MLYEGRDLLGGRFYCNYCSRVFVWILIEDSNHFSKEASLPDRPTYCPCCGGYAKLMFYVEKVVDIGTDE
jgi:hypothetical protein